MTDIPENDHRSFQTPSTWIPLFEVDTGGSILYLTPGSVSQTVDGHEYLPFPIMMDEMSQNDQGEVKNVKLICSDIEGTLVTTLKQTGSIDGNDVVFKIYSVEIGEVVLEEYLQIIHCGPCIEGTVTFELGMFNPYMVKLLQEKFFRDFCWNRYKQKGCWITKRDGTFLQPADFTAGSPDTCDHTLTDCIRHTNALRISTCPGIPGYGGYV